MDSYKCFNGDFKCSIAGARFPACLRELYLGCDFNQLIDSVAWLGEFQLLFTPRFDYPIDNVQWPEGLKVLEFVLPSEIKFRNENVVDCDYIGFLCIGFNQPLDSSLPAGLETFFCMYHAFGQSLNDVTWPTGIVTLGLGDTLRGPSFKEVAWPPSLQHSLLVYHLEHSTYTFRDFKANVFDFIIHPDEEEEFHNELLA